MRGSDGNVTGFCLVRMDLVKISTSYCRDSLRSINSERKRCRNCSNHAATNTALGR